MKTLILTIGLPRSGKSTWAQAQHMPIVNPDAVRLALHGYSFVTEAEPMVWTMTMYMVKALFLAGHECVIVDATHTTKKRRDAWQSPEWNVESILFSTPKDECCKRAEKDGREDLKPVILIYIYIITP